MIASDTYAPTNGIVVSPNEASSSAPTEHHTTGNPEMELIFLGTGTSGSVPTMDCLTAPPGRPPCRTCLSTLTPEGKVNIRRNTSAVVRVTAGKDGKKTTLVIDVGKNFLAAAVEWFPRYGLREIDAVLITHAHADAMNGLDDLRGWTLRGAIQKHIDVYVSQDTYREVRRAFPYLVAKEFASGGGDVPEFKWHIIEDKVTFEIKDTGIRVTPFLVHHGRLFTPAPDVPAGHAGAEITPKIRPYLCFGFLVHDRIVYMSDVSLIPADAWPVILACDQKSVLVIDCLRLKEHTSHMGVREAGSAIRRIGARRSYLTGFNHDVSHEEFVSIGEGVAGKEGEVNVNVKQGIDMMRDGLEGEVHWIRPAHDGLRVVVLPDGRVCDGTYP